MSQGTLARARFPYQGRRREQDRPEKDKRGVDVNLNEDQTMLHDMTRRFLEERAPI